MHILIVPDKSPFGSINNQDIQDAASEFLQIDVGSDSEELCVLLNTSVIDANGI